jgi:hypothetical protein
MPVKHSFVSGRGDNSDPGAIQPSQWNDDHELTGILALLDALAASPNMVLTFDGSANFQLLPVANFAGLNSPAFTGIPTVPTAVSTVNSGQIASTEYVTTAITNLIGGAPGALNTLNELATAINDDASYAATVTAALGVRLRVDATQGLSSGQQAQGRANLGLGTASVLAAGTGANNVLQLDGSGKIPAVDGSQLTNIPGSPVGACVYFPTNSAPIGWLPRNGALISRTTYAALWAFAQASGNITASDAAWSATTAGQFSPGDGSTTFRLPDDRGEFIRSWDNGRGVYDSGRAIGSDQADAFQGHFHSSNGLRYLSPDVNFAAPTPTGSSVYGYVSPSVGAPITDGTNGTPRTAAETRPRNVAWLGCIKY